MTKQGINFEIYFRILKYLSNSSNYINETNLIFIYYSLFKIYIRYDFVFLVSSRKRKCYMPTSIWAIMILLCFETCRKSVIRITCSQKIWEMYMIICLFRLFRLFRFFCLFRFFFQNL